MMYSSCKCCVRYENCAYKGAYLSAVAICKAQEDKIFGWIKMRCDYYVAKNAQEIHEVICGPAEPDEEDEP